MYKGKWEHFLLIVATSYTMYVCLESTSICSVKWYTVPQVMRQDWNAEVQYNPTFGYQPLLTWLPRNRRIKEIGHNCCTRQCFFGNPFLVNICAFLHICMCIHAYECMTHTYICVNRDQMELGVAVGSAVGGAVGSEVRGVVKLAGVQAHISWTIAFGVHSTPLNALPHKNFCVCSMF